MITGYSAPKTYKHEDIQNNKLKYYYLIISWSYLVTNHANSASEITLQLINIHEVIIIKVTRHSDVFIIQLYIQNTEELFV